MGGDMTVLKLLKVFSLSSTIALVSGATWLWAPKAEAAIGNGSQPGKIVLEMPQTSWEISQQSTNFAESNLPVLLVQAQQSNSQRRQQIAEQVILLHRQMVGTNVRLSSRYLAAYVNCIEQNVCTWDDIRAHIAQTNPLADRDRGRFQGEYNQFPSRPTSSSARNDRPISQRRNIGHREQQYNQEQVLQAQSNQRQEIEEQVRRLYRQMLGNNARISRRELREYASCIQRERCSWNDVREDIAYSDAGERAIEQIYQEVLERNPDRSGMNTYQNRLSRNWNIEDIRKDIANSDEAEQAINRLYREILGRNADRNGLRTYRRKLAEDWSLDKVRRDISNSDEARRRRGG